MRFFTVVLVLAAAASLSSCKKDDPASPASAADQFTNKLTLGTAMNLATFSLSGEGSNFTRTGTMTTIFYRLESATDYAGAGISIKIEKQAGNGYTAVATYPYSNPQSYGHIIMSAFGVVDAGTYRATGLLTATSGVVASATFVVQ